MVSSGHPEHFSSYMMPIRTRRADVQLIVRGDSWYTPGNDCLNELRRPVKQHEYDVASYNVLPGIAIACALEMPTRSSESPPPTDVATAMSESNSFDLLRVKPRCGRHYTTMWGLRVAGCPQLRPH